MNDKEFIKRGSKAKINVAGWLLAGGIKSKQEPEKWQELSKDLMFLYRVCSQHAQDIRDGRFETDSETVEKE